MTPSRTETASQSTSNDEWPLPTDGVSVTHLLIVRDTARARHSYVGVLGWLTTIATVPGYVRPLRNLLVRIASRMVQQRLARRLSLLDDAGTMPQDDRVRRAPHAA